jgi:parallel beta-helix repeat protein
LKNIDINFTGIDAIWLHSKVNFSITNSKIQNTNNNGVYLSWANTNAIIENNYFYNTGMQEGMGQSNDLNQLAIFNSEGGASIQNNVIINTGYNGIHFGGYDNVIKNNYIDTFCVVKDDGGGIYTYDGANNNGLPNSKVIGNLVFNGLGAAEGTTNANGSAEGIYIDDNCSDIDIIGNTVFNIANNGIFIHNSDDITIKNNLVYDAKRQLYTKNDYLTSRTISGIDLSNNILFCKEPNQMAAEFYSVDDDINNLGTFDNNYFIRPINDGLVIQEEYEKQSISSKLRRSFDLQQWQTNRNQDPNSITTPIQINQYQVLNTYGNLIVNGTFDNDIQGTGGWSLNSDHNTAWDNNHLDNGCFEIDAPTEMHTGFNIGSVDSSKTYLVKFSAIANKDATLNIAIWQSNWPWGTLLGHHPINVSTSRGEYELLLKNIPNEANASLMFRLATENLNLYLDNVEFMEVDANQVDPNDHFDFFYNETLNPKTISLNKSYIDENGNAVNNSITLPSFSGKVLIVNGLVTKNEALVESSSLFEIYPNPANQNLFLNAEGNAFRIMDITGQTIMQNQILSPLTRISIPNDIENGTYLIAVIDKQGGIETKKFILQR